MKALPPGLGFNENSEVVATTDFDYDNVDAATEAERSEAELVKYRQEVVRNLLVWLAQSKATPHQVGVRVLILAHILGRQGTRKELAARLRVSRQRVHQILTASQRELACLRGCGGL